MVRACANKVTLTAVSPEGWGGYLASKILHSSFRKCRTRERSVGNLAMESEAGY